MSVGSEEQMPRKRVMATVVDRRTPVRTYQTKLSSVQSDALVELNEGPILITRTDGIVRRSNGKFPFNTYVALVKKKFAKMEYVDAHTAKFELKVKK